MTLHYKLQYQFLVIIIQKPLFSYQTISNIDKQFFHQQHNNNTSTMQQNKSQQQPELLRELRERTLTLQYSIEKQNNKKKQSEKLLHSLQKEQNKLCQEKQIQLRKNKSFIVLLHELQQLYYQNYMQSKLGYHHSSSRQSENDRIQQNGFLRHLLIKQTQNNKELSKLLSFLKQLQGTKIQSQQQKNSPKQFIKKSNFLEGQSEIIAKLYTQLQGFRNQNLQCTRKWYQLQQQKNKLQNEGKLYAVQQQRQKIQLKQQYEIYLDRMNQAKMKLVQYNQNNRENSITDYFVKEIAVLQQRRVQVQEESSNLKYHYQNLKQQLTKIEVQNRQLNSFFKKQNNLSNQQCILALKMKKRIEQLRDILIEQRRKNKDTRNIKLSKIIQSLRHQFQTLLQTNHFMQMRVRQQQDYGASLEQKPIADFFSEILSKKDQQLIILKQRQSSLYEEHKQLEIRKRLLENQISNMEDNVNLGGYEAKYNEKQQWRNTTNTYFGITNISQDAKPQPQRSTNGNWKKVAKQTNTALGMETYFDDGNYK